MSLKSSLTWKTDQLIYCLLIFSGLSCMLLTTNTLLLIEFIIYTKFKHTLYLISMQSAIHEQICWSRFWIPGSKKIRNFHTGPRFPDPDSTWLKWPKYLTFAARSRLAKSKTLNRRPFGDFPIFIGTFAKRDFARLSCMIVLKFDVRLLIRENELFIIPFYDYSQSLFYWKLIYNTVYITPALEIHYIFLKHFWR